MENSNDVQKTTNVGNEVLADVRQRYICKECGTEHFLTDLIMADNGWDYTYSCKKCGDIMESNGTYYW